MFNSHSLCLRGCVTGMCDRQPVTGATHTSVAQEAGSVSGVLIYGTMLGTDQVNLFSSRLSQRGLVKFRHSQGDDSGKVCC